MDGWRDVLPIDRANRLLEMPFTPFQESVAATDTRVSVRGTVTAVSKRRFHSTLNLSSTSSNKTHFIIKVMIKV
jgi:hypothetical protein